MPSESCTTESSHPESPRSAGPRAVVAHLALYLNETNHSKKAQRRSDLVEALKAYDTFLLDHFDMIGRDTYPSSSGLHDEFDENLAPYFAPAASLYATAALGLLSRDSKEPEAKELTRLQLDIGNKIRSQFQEDGLFKREGTKSYSASVSYDNAQIGLALIALLDPQKDACATKVKNPPLGVLDPILSLASRTPEQLVRSHTLTHDPAVRK